MNDKKKLPDYAEVVSEAPPKPSKRKPTKKIAGPAVAQDILPDYAEVVSDEYPQQEMSNLESIIEGAKDAIITLPQSTTLELGDDVLKLISPELGETYEKEVEQARERSPKATIGSDILAPNPLTKITKGAKALKYVGKYAPDTATSAAIQYGREGEIDPWETAADVALGATLQKGASKILKGDRLKRRAVSVGAARPSIVKKVSQKAGRGKEGDYVIQEIKKLEDTGIFRPGAVRYDAKNRKFVTRPGPIESVKGTVIPPSTKEMNKRLSIMKSDIGAELEDIVRRNKEGTSFTIEDRFFSDLAEAINSPNYQNRKTPNRIFEDVFNRFTRGKDILNTEDVPNAVFDLEDMQRVKRELYDIIGDRAYEKSLQDNPDAKKAYQTAAAYIADKLNQEIGDPGFKKLNNMYGTASLIKNAIEKKAFSEFTEGGRLSEMALNNPLYRATRILEDKRESLFGASAQFTDTLQRNPGIEDYLRGMGKAFIPRTGITGKAQEEVPEYLERRPDSIPTRKRPLSSNLPNQLIKTKLPRTVEGLIANKDVLLAKAAQQAPEYFEQVRFIVEERPEDIEQVMPMIMQLAPHIFESDKYNRVNHKILDPMMQQKAREDIMEDPNLSNVQKVNMIDKLNRTNILEDY